MRDYNGEEVMFDLKAAAGYLGATGSALVDLDDNTQGWEDFVGALLMYVAEVLISVSAGGDLPEFPEILKKGTSDKISGPFRASLIVANSILGFAQFQVTGKAAQILKYANQAIRQLISGQPVPPVPAALLA